RTPQAPGSPRLTTHWRRPGATGPHPHMASRRSSGAILFPAAPRGVPSEAHLPIMDAMNLTPRILPPENIVLDLAATSKKRAFEHAGLLFENHQGVARTSVFHSLLSRERLGSTALGPAALDLQAFGRQDAQAFQALDVAGTLHLHDADLVAHDHR